ncbi:cytochrome b5 domain-containing protein 1 [Archocentrus centrarchus]|uniref:cytochrome b5 domain-containing protein 1 n=1 Tax=Archocentrus centrarchus TaxID=63155 RepID=UPI0011E9C5A3|nr:cytochrome b5 domain-containing protein 1 [Archocentrus centrarchus]
MLRPRYFTPSEVAAHNTAEDLWVSFLGKVCDLSPLMSRHKGDILLLPIMEFAGKDISSWFDPKTEDILKYVDPLTSCVAYYTPRGRFLHIPPTGPRSDWDGDIGQPWWKDRRYEVGLLSAKTGWIRVVNTLTSQEQRLEVCSEENLNEILQRYLRYNSHARSYTWKYNGAVLDMNKTLSENNVPDDDLELEQLRLDRDAFTPAVLLHYNDDLTEG